MGLQGAQDLPPDPLGALGILEWAPGGPKLKTEGGVLMKCAYCRSEFLLRFRFRPVLTEIPLGGPLGGFGNFGAGPRGAETRNRRRRTNETCILPSRISSQILISTRFDRNSLGGPWGGFGNFGAGPRGAETRNRGWRTNETRILPSGISSQISIPRIPCPSDSHRNGPPGPPDPLGPTRVVQIGIFLQFLHRGDIYSIVRPLTFFDSATRSWRKREGQTDTRKVQNIDQTRRRRRVW